MHYHLILSIKKIFVSSIKTVLSILAPGNFDEVKIFVQFLSAQFVVALDVGLLFLILYGLLVIFHWFFHHFICILLLEAYK